MQAQPLQGRRHQLEALDCVLSELRKDAKGTICVMPTGTGKTVVAALLSKHVWDEFGIRTLFVAERRKLIGQAKATILRTGLKVHTEMGIDNARKLAAREGYSQVVVGTPQTLNGERLASWSKDHFGLVIFDECHHSLAPGYLDILKQFDKSWLVGLTATPGRGDKKNLGRVYQSQAYRLPYAQATAEKLIVPIDPVTLRVSVDLRKIKMTQGDMNVGDLAERIGPKIEELCRAIYQEAGDLHSVIFTPDVASAQAVAQVLTKLGTSDGRVYRYVAGQGGKFGMKRSESDAILAEFDRCDIQGVVCNELLVEGYDCSHVECVVIARPTLSRFRYAQMAGRGTRLCDEIGKTKCLLLDLDWTTDDSCRDIVSPVELFDDSEESMSEDVKAEVKKLLKKKAKEDARLKRGERTYTDIAKLIEEAEESIRSRPSININLTGKVVKYEKYHRDPKGVAKILGIPMKYYDTNPSRGGGEAWASQIKRLKELGVKHPEGISNWGARKQIRELELRAKLGLCTIDQVQRLLVLGVGEGRARSMNKEEAAEMLTESHQGSLFS